MGRTAWSEERVRALLADHEFGYQRIELPYGLSTGGVDRGPTARRVLPADLEGKSVLDLGCKHGYFCFEAKRRGAGRVVGVDVDPDSVEKARLLADCLGLDVSFEGLDIEEDPLPEPFDYVLCLNLLHHLRDPLAALDRLTAITRERLVLEVAALGAHDRRKLGLSRRARRALNRAPILYVSRNGTSGRRSVQKFFITEGAIENRLRRHRNHFARVDFHPSEHKDRYVAVAHRRRVGRLLVVTGPTAVGKSTFLRRLRAGWLPEVARRLELGDVSTWTETSASVLASFEEPRTPRLLFHYDFLRPYLRSAKTHARDEALDVLDAAEELTIVTLWAPPEVLRARLLRSEIGPRTVLGLYFGRKRHKRILADYEDPERVREHYRAWFRYVRGRPGRHWVVTVPDGAGDGAASAAAELRSVDEWEAREGRGER